MQADVLSQVILPLSLFVIMMGMGLSLSLKDFAAVAKNPKAVVLGLSAQLIVLPLLALLMVTVFTLPPYVAVGFFIIALCPSGTTSNLYSYLAKGDIALSISLTAVVSLITPFTLPIVLSALMTLHLSDSHAIELPILKTIIQLLVITVLPIGIGMIINRRAPEFARQADKPVRVFSVVFLMLIIAGIIIKNIHVIPPYFAMVGLPVLAMNIASMLLGFGLASLARLNMAQRTTIGLEVGIQNGTTALLIALTILQNTEMSMAPTVYSLVMFATGTVFAKWLLKRNIPEVTG
mgnify:CR=1 FL=1